MIVTTFSPEGYEKYGKRFVETYKQHCDMPLVIYVEDDLKIDGVDTRNLFDVPGCDEFLEKVAGHKPNSYREDVNKFSRKVFAMTNVGLTYNDRFAFIGADTVFHSDIPDNFFDVVLKNKYLGYLGRTQMHSETDFIAFDCSKVINSLFMSLFIRIYTTGAFMHQKYYCDSDVFDFVRILLSPPANNLNVIDDHNHPFVNSVLGKYMDHLKGPIRKEAGRSFDNDYVDNRKPQIQRV